MGLSYYYRVSMLVPMEAERLWETLHPQETIHAGVLERGDGSIGNYVVEERRYMSVCSLTPTALYSISLTSMKDLCILFCPRTNLAMSRHLMLISRTVSLQNGIPFFGAAFSPPPNANSTCVRCYLLCASCCFMHWDRYAVVEQNISVVF